MPDSNQFCRFCLEASNEELGIKLTQIDENLSVITRVFFQNQIILCETDSSCSSCESQLKNCYEFYQKTLSNQKLQADSGVKAEPRVKVEPGIDEIVLENQALREVIENCCPEFIDFDSDDQDQGQVFENQDQDLQNQNIDSCFKGEKKEPPPKKKRGLGRPRKVKPGPKQEGLRGSHELIKQFYSLTCDICLDNPKFDEYFDLKRHMSKAHQTQKVWECCGQKLVQRVELAEHAKHHIKPNTCCACGLTEPDKKTFKQHLKKCGPPRCFECAHCSKSFKSKSIVRQHLLTIHFKQETKVTEFMCEICAKIFLKQYSLDQHLIYDHSEKPLTEQCPMCGKVVSKRNYGLKTHIKMCHEDEGKIFLCPECGKEFTKERTMAKHRTWYHTKGRSYMCSMCSKGFFTKKRLREHEATHTGELIYKCPFCGFGFKSSGNYYAHLRRLHPVEFETIRKKKKETVEVKE